MTTTQSETAATVREVSASAGTLNAVLDTLNERLADVFAEPAPRISTEPLHKLSVSGDVTLRDDLDVKEGQEVTIVLTARIVRIDSPHGNLFYAHVLGADSVEGQDVVTGPSEAELRQAERSAWAAYSARQAAARDIRFGRIA